MDERVKGEFALEYTGVFFSAKTYVLSLVCGSTVPDQQLTIFVEVIRSLATGNDILTINWRVRHLRLWPHFSIIGLMLFTPCTAKKHDSDRKNDSPAVIFFPKSVIGTSIVKERAVCFLIACLQSMIQTRNPSKRVPPFGLNKTGTTLYLFGFLDNFHESFPSGFQISTL